MKRTAQLGRVGNNLPRMRSERKKKALYPKRPQDQVNTRPTPPKECK